MISAESKGPSSPPVYHFLAGAWAYVMFGFAATVVGPTLQPIRESFGLGLAELGLIFPFTAVGYVVSSLIGSVASDRYGRRPFVIAGTTSIAAGIAVMALAPAWSVLLMGGVIAGFGMGLLDGPLNALIVDMTPGGAAKWLNFLHLFFGIGALAGPILAGIALARDVDWRLIYGAVALVGLTTTVPFAFLRISNVNIGRPPSLAAMRRSAAQPIVLLMMVVLALYVGFEVTVSGWLPSFFELEHGYTRGFAGVSVSVVWAGILVGRLLAGLLVRWMGPLPLLALFLAVASPIALTASLIENHVVALVGFGLVGVLIAGAFPTGLAVGVTNQKSMTGALTGIMVASAGIGAIVFPPIVGAVAGPLGLQAAMAMTAVLCGAAALTVWWAMVHYGRHPDRWPNRVGDAQDPVQAAAAGVSQALERSDK